MTWKPVATQRIRPALAWRTVQPVPGSAFKGRCKVTGRGGRKTRKQKSAIQETFEVLDTLLTPQLK